MSDRIFTNQKIGLSATITEDDTAVDISGGTVVFEYYLPGNNTGTPESSTISGSIVSGPDGTVTGEIPAATNTLPGDWRVQAVVTVGGDTYRALTTCFTVYSKGTGATC